MILGQGTTNQVDLGASVGGAEFIYTPSVVSVEIDQTLMPVVPFKSKEEAVFAVALTQYQMSLIAVAFNYASTAVSTTTASTLVAPAAPTVVVNAGAAAVTYSYTLIGVTVNGDSIPSPVGTTATGPTALTATNSITASWPATTNPGIIGWRLQRTAGGPSTGLLTVNPTGSDTKLLPASATSFTDTGVAASAYTAATAAPATPNVDQFNYGQSNALMQTFTFDWVCPKSDGTNNRIVGHLNKVSATKAVKLDYKRDKATELSKVELMAYADLTQAAGAVAGWLREEY